MLFCLDRGLFHRPLVLSSLYEDVSIATMKSTKVVITSQNVDDMIRTSQITFIIPKHRAKRNE
jgi:hypothetical protein